VITDTTRRLFADRNFRLYTIASVVSWLSFFAQTLAVSWLAWELTHSPTWLAIITVLDIAPYFLLGPWGSVLADRLDRHRMLFIAYVCALIQSLLLAGTAMAGVLGIGMLGVLAFLHGTIHAFSVPAAYGLLPRAVRPEQLPAAIAFSSSYRTLAMFAGPALAGVLLAWFPVYVSFLFNVAGYALYLLMMQMMRLPPAVPAPRSGKSVYGDYRDGLRYSLNHPVIGLLLMLTFFSDALRGLTHRLLPAFAARLFGDGPSGLAILAGATGLGAAIASVWLSQRRGTQAMGRVILGGLAVGILTTVLFVATRDIWLAVGSRIVFGLAAEAALTATIILLQSQVEDAYRARVMGLWFMVSQLSNLLLLLVGPLAERFGLDAPIYAVTALALLALVFFHARMRQR
jgi:MFS family permease